MRSRPRHSTSSHEQTNSCERRIVLLGYPALVLLDMVGPCEVFSIANRISRRIHPERPDPYKLEVVTVDRKRQIPAMSGLTLVSDGHFQIAGVPSILSDPRPPADTDALTRNTALLKWLARTAPCTSDESDPSVPEHSYSRPPVCYRPACDRRIGTPVSAWHAITQGISVDPNSIVKDGNVRIHRRESARRMDLALALVEEDLGKDIALNVARTLVMSCGVQAARANSACCWNLKREDLGHRSAT